MKRKEVDDVMGGEGAWDNVDQTEGTHPILWHASHTHGTGANKGYDFSAMSQRRLRRDEGVLLFGADPKRGRADDGVFQGVHILRSSFCA